uniref:Secreted protein n=1 Tax=Heterorhabditis bacteriophora TaxID=37862 RepID=A0A1I7W7R4_HETBA
MTPSDLPFRLVCATCPAICLHHYTNRMREIVVMSKSSASDFDSFSFLYTVIILKNNCSRADVLACNRSTNGHLSRTECVKGRERLWTPRRSCTNGYRHKSDAQELIKDSPMDLCLEVFQLAWMVALSCLKVNGSGNVGNMGL